MERPAPASIADAPAAGTTAPELAYRPLLFSIAYRMLGSVTESEDVVQESFLRLHRARQDGVVIESPKAYLSALATRLAIDTLRSARVQRESYVGPWLPEPVLAEERAPTSQAETAESVSLAFLLILETLSPIERAVFLLRESFDYSYEEIAPIVEKSPENCRQIWHRAKRSIDARKSRFTPTAAKRSELAERFFVACQRGELEPLIQLLASDAAFYSDGGGKTIAAGRPLFGRDRVARFLLRIFSRYARGRVHLRRTLVNGDPGALITDSDGRVLSVIALDLGADSVQCVRSVMNPDKLRHLGVVSDRLRRRGPGGRPGAR